MWNHFQDLLFVFNMIDMLTLDNILFLHCLECKFLRLILLKECYLNISKSTYKQKSLKHVQKYRWKLLCIESCVWQHSYSQVWKSGLATTWCCNIVCVTYLLLESIPMWSRWSCICPKTVDPFLLSPFYILFVNII